MNESLAQWSGIEIFTESKLVQIKNATLILMEEEIIHTSHDDDPIHICDGCMDKLKSKKSTDLRMYYTIPQIDYIPDIMVTKHISCSSCSTLIIYRNQHKNRSTSLMTDCLRKIKYLPIKK